METTKCEKHCEKPRALDQSKIYSAITADSTRASEFYSASANSVSPVNHHMAFMTNKTGVKTPYVLQIGEGELRVLSFSKGSIKAQLSLATMHAKLAPKQSNGGQAEDEEEESKDTPTWYPIKVMITPKKSRMLFFETRKQRKEVLEAILTEQGFEN